MWKHQVAVDECTSARVKAIIRFHWFNLEPCKVYRAVCFMEKWEFWSARWIHGHPHSQDWWHFRQQAEVHSECHWDWHHPTAWTNHPSMHGTRCSRTACTSWSRKGWRTVEQEDLNANAAAAVSYRDLPWRPTGSWFHLTSTVGSWGPQPVTFHHGFSYDRLQLQWAISPMQMDEETGSGGPVQSAGVSAPSRRLERNTGNSSGSTGGGESAPARRYW